MQNNVNKINKINNLIFSAYAKVKDKMPPPKVREVNVIPITKVKREVLSEDEDEDMVSCRMCNKTFVSEIALLNHARVEHLDEYMAGEELCVRPNVKQKRKFTDKEQEQIKIKTEALISSMEPTNIMSLASNDVSYIIIKDGQPEVKKWKKDKLKNDNDKSVKIIKTVVKKEREVKAISGPFECLQPSPHNSEGLCHQIFLSCCEYSTHFRDEHTRRRKALRCQVCEKPLLENDQLAPYSCQVCGMGFENTKDLTEHNQTAHLKLKPFQCNICQKRFTQQGGVHQHMRMHTGDRPFTCTFCPKAFTQKSGLDQHLRIHTKVKPYRCIICNKSFCQSVHLQQHMRTHTNVAPFQCGICQKRFKQSSHLNYHLKYHNPANMTEEQKKKYAELVQLIGTKGMLEVEIDTVQPGLFLEQVESDEVTEYIVSDNNWENTQAQ
ncbi:unnamed protein product, partial [Brenthis ino]